MGLGEVIAGKIDPMNIADHLAKSNLPSAVRDALLAQLALVEEQAGLAKQQSGQIKFRDQHIAALTLEIAHLRRMRYGVRAESLSAEQRQLFEDTLDSDIAAIEVRVEAAAPKEKRERAGRQALPAHLPRTEILHEPDSCSCAECGLTLAKMGDDV
ncbi:IS66 family transposase, partial [Iodobacter sp. BJB302]|uniref:IS66 family transposase n=1 Tax=Iodobacter sp. BJB302 TaxID=1506510 RepID=UPI000C11E531